MRKAKKGPRLVVAMQFNWEGVGAIWAWEIRVPRRFTIKPTATYTTRQGARRVGRQVAKQLSIELVN